MNPSGIINCHVQGLDSVVYKSHNGQLQRAFFAIPKHMLWTNAPPFESPMSLAFHAHDYPVRLIQVFGNAYNVTPAKQGKPYTMAEYRSKAADPEKGVPASFERTGMSIHQSYKMELITDLTMQAHDYHSVYVPKGEGACWRVLEGPRTESPREVYSNQKLEHWDSSLLYQPMPFAVLTNYLEFLGE